MCFNCSSERHTEHEFEVSVALCLQQSSTMLCDYMTKMLMLICDCFVKCKLYDMLPTIYTLVHMHKHALKIISCWKLAIEYDAKVLDYKWDNMIELQYLRIGLLIIGYV